MNVILVQSTVLLLLLLLDEIANLDALLLYWCQIYRHSRCVRLTSISKLSSIVIILLNLDL